MRELGRAVENHMNNIVATTRTPAGPITSSFPAIGRGIVQGVINGVGSMAAALNARMKKLSAEAREAFKRELDSRSPSEKMRLEGRDTGIGAVLRVDETVDPMKRASERLAHAAKEPLENLRLSSTAGLPGVAAWRPGQTDRLPAGFFGGKPDAGGTARPLGQAGDAMPVCLGK